MPVVMPSQLVAVIDELYPFAKSMAPQNQLLPQETAKMRAIVALIRQVPQELLEVSGNDYAALMVAISQIEVSVESNIARGPTYSFLPSSVTTLRQVLARCPDEFPPPTTVELTFIPDDELRRSIREDIASATRSFSEAHWKASTVIAGATIEALLRWRLGTELPASVSSATAGAARSFPPSLDEWNLGQYITVCESLGILRAETVTSARLAKDFRNLIHPGRSARLDTICDRGTAHVALGALDHVVRDLQ